MIRNSTIIRYLSSKWISSGKILPTVSLIVLPSVVILSQFLINYVDSLLSNISFVDLPLELVALKYSVTIFQYSVVAIILFVYPPYPFPISIKRYFEQRGYENAVFEYGYLKRFLEITVPIFIIVTIIPPIINPLLKQYSQIDLTEISQMQAFKIAQTYLLFIVSAGILKMLLVAWRKNFRLYFAKGCFKIVVGRKESLNKQYESESMLYLIKGLGSYNSYLQRNFRLQIKDLKRIISRIMGMVPQEKHNTVMEISSTFTEDEIEEDTLRPLRKLHQYSPSSPFDEFLAQQPLLDRVKGQTTLAITIIPLVISMIDLYSKFTK